VVIPWCDPVNFLVQESSDSDSAERWHGGWVGRFVAAFDNVVMPRAAVAYAAETWAALSAV